VGKKLLCGLGKNVDRLSAVLRGQGFEVITDCCPCAATSMFGRHGERAKQGVPPMIFDSSDADDGSSVLCYDKLIKEISDAARRQLVLCEKPENKFQVAGPC
jgi:hypothetical protein